VIHVVIGRTGGHNERRMRLRPHLGTLLFPPVVLLYAPFLSQWRTDDAFVCLTAALGVFAVLAIISWRFLRRYPGLGVYYSACVVLLFPVTQRMTSDDLLEVLLGSTSVIGAVGVIYFAVRGVRFGADVPPPPGSARAHGFPVIPEARRAETVVPARAGASPLESQ
jgi:hypothetical protein